MAVTRARAGDATVDLGPVRLGVESGNLAGGIDLTAKRIEDDSTIMGEIADLMVGFVRTSIEYGEYLALSPESVKRREHPWTPKRGFGTRGPVSGARPLVASGALLRGIKPRSRQGYAAARRGNEWYGFLHDRGVGRLDERSWMQMTAADQDWAASVYDEWLGRQIEGGEA